MTRSLPLAASASFAVALALVLAPVARSEENAAPATATEVPKLTAATKTPFAPDLEVAGSFAPEAAVEVVYRPKAYGAELDVLEAASAGPVAKGATLVRFDTTKIEEQIRAAEADLAVARESLAKAVEDGKLVEEATKISLARHEADATRSEEAYRVFKEVEAPLRIKETEHRVQGTRDSIVDQEEELAQLEKMYKADEITEETEDIVMKRAKRQLMRSRHSLGFLLDRQRLLVEVELPREEENHDLARRKEKSDWERTRATAPIALAEKRLEVEKTRGAVERQASLVERLGADREAMTVVAPVAGFAVPGAFWNGKWVALDDNAKALRPGRRAPAHHTLYTVFTPGALRVRTTVAEAMVFRLRPGAAATVAPSADPSLASPARVTEVSLVAADGQYEVWLKPEKVDPRLMPGHACKVTITGLERRDAVTVPTTSVRRDGEKGVVHLWEDGKAVAKEVKLGGTSGGRTEVVEGLDAGAQVLETAPPK